MHDVWIHYETPLFWRIISKKMFGLRYEKCNWISLCDSSLHTHRQKKNPLGSIKRWLQLLHSGFFSSCESPLSIIFTLVKGLKEICFLIILRFLPFEIPPIPELQKYFDLHIALIFYLPQQEKLASHKYILFLEMPKCNLFRPFISPLVTYSLTELGERIGLN